MSLAPKYSAAQNPKATNNVSISTNPQLVMQLQLHQWNLAGTWRTRSSSEDNCVLSVTRPRLSAASFVIAAQVEDPEPHSLEFRAAAFTYSKSAWAVLKTECALVPLRTSQRSAPVRGWLAPGTALPLLARIRALVFISGKTGNNDAPPYRIAELPAPICQLGCPNCFAHRIFAEVNLSPVPAVG